MGRTLTGHSKWITWICWEPLHLWVWLQSSLFGCRQTAEQAGTSRNSQRNIVSLLCSHQQSRVPVFGQQLKRRLSTYLGHRVGPLWEDPDWSHSVGHLCEVGRRRAALHIVPGQDGQSLESQRCKCLMFVCSSGYHFSVNCTYQSISACVNVVCRGPSAGPCRATPTGSTLWPSAQTTSCAPELLNLQQPLSTPRTSPDRVRVLDLSQNSRLNIYKGMLSRDHFVHLQWKKWRRKLCKDIIKSG